VGVDVGVKVMTFRCAILFAFCTAANPWLAAAADIVLTGEAACHSIGGAWSGVACAVERLTVPADTRLFTVPGVALSTGDAIIDGLLQIEGEFEATRTLHNRGTLITRSFIVNRAQVLNQGSWLNQGTFLSDETVVNEWYFDNRGLFQTRAADFINRMYTVIAPGGQIWNAGGLLVNEGLVSNSGYLNNPAGSTLDNAGVIVTSDATVFNFGRAIGRCGSAYYVRFTGIFVGNPVELEPCTDSDAVAGLAEYVFDLGKRRLIAKSDAIEWRNMLKKSSKRLAKGDQAEGLELLRAFVAEVPTRTGFPVSNVLLARGLRALELVIAP
jgi:hypothetical protein